MASSLKDDAYYQRITSRIDKLQPDSKGKWGKMDNELWGQLQYKHCDHHLRQFGV